MRCLCQPSTDPHFNMAFDEMALTELSSPEPVFYLWQNAPAVIIGRNQSAHAEVNLPYLEEHGIVLARRVTGGGAVYHDLGNLNYSFVGGVREMESLEPVSRIASALRSLGIQAEVSGRNDILVEGRKCSGYAKRLSGTRMMVHGTLMFDVDLSALSAALSAPSSKFSTGGEVSHIAMPSPDRASVSAAGIASVRSRVCNLKDYLPGWSLEDFRKTLSSIIAGGDTSVFPSDTSVIPSDTSVFPSEAKESVSPAFLARVNALADSKFRTWDWIYGQSPATDYCVRRKFPTCGTVELRFSVRHGLLADVQFSGDFLGDLPTDAPLPEDSPAAGQTLPPSPAPGQTLTPSPAPGQNLLQILNGTRYDAVALSSVLSPLPVSRYFDGLTADDLLSLLLEH